MLLEPTRASINLPAIDSRLVDTDIAPFEFVGKACAKPINVRKEPRLLKSGDFQILRFGFGEIVTKITRPLIGR
jgi:hypothetical protein